MLNLDTHVLLYALACGEPAFENSATSELPVPPSQPPVMRRALSANDVVQATDAERF